MLLLPLLLPLLLLEAAAGARVNEYHRRHRGQLWLARELAWESNRGADRIERARAGRISAGLTTIERQRGPVWVAIRYVW